MRSAFILGTALLLAGSVLGAATEPVEPPEQDPFNLKGLFDRGFSFTTADNRFAMRIAAAIQFRYTYVDYDPAVEGNQDDYSNFYLRRARLWWIGHAFDPRFTYVFHLQLEPNFDVNLHDAWVEYEFNKWFRLGVGRYKIAYGLEFMNSGFALESVERSVFSGETDIDIGAGFLQYGPKYPGGGTARFGMDWTDVFTGFPTGGLLLGRSQGIQARGMTEPHDKGFVFEYQAGIWQGRATRGKSNRTDGMLYAVRTGFYPFGWIDWRSQGDMKNSRHPKVGVLLSAYADDDVRASNAEGFEVPAYDVRDRGFDVAVQSRYRGFSADLEWAHESYEADDPALTVNRWEREGWRIQAGYFFKPKRYQMIARYAEIRRLTDPTVAGALDSGLNVPSIWNPATGQFEDALEKKIREVTLGFNVYLSRSHGHKVSFDVTRLVREFAEVDEPGYFTPGDQEDSRLRAMLQFLF